MESDFWKLVRVAKASVAVRTVVVEDEEEAPSPAAWKGGSCLSVTRATRRPA